MKEQKSFIQKTIDEIDFSLDRGCKILHCYAMLDTKNINHFTADNNDLFLIDGSGFIFRAFHALPMMTRPDGTPVNAVFGFTNMLIKLLTEIHAKKILVVFDAARKNFRNDIYPAYKANRSETPEELIPQFSLIRDATTAFNLPQLEIEGFEADDLIATYVNIAKQNNQRVTIVSSDKDLMQLVGDGACMFDPMKSKIIHEPEVFEKFGVTPDKVIDVQALCGDSTDNVPGVPGIGPKTAAELIQTYGSLESLLENLDQIKQPKRRESLIAHREDAIISKQLVRLKSDVPVPVSIDSLALPVFDEARLRSFLEEQGFRSTLSRLEKAGLLHGIGQSATSAPSVITQQKTPKQYEIIETESQLKALVTKIHEQGTFSFQTEILAAGFDQVVLVGLCFAIGSGEAFYIPLNHQLSRNLLNMPENPTEGEKQYQQLDQASVLSALKPLFESSALLKISHDVKREMKILAHFDIDVRAFDDILTMSYLLDGALHAHTLESLSSHYFDHVLLQIKDIVGDGRSVKPLDQVSISVLAGYASEKADYIFQLHQILKPRLRTEQLLTLYEEIERPLIPVVAEMEQVGVKLDAFKLQEISSSLQRSIANLEKRIYELAGEEFNIGSPKQLGEILFTKLNLASAGKGKSGQLLTHIDILEPLAEQGYEIARKILDWRHVSKLKGTYADALPKQIDPRTGRVHTTYGLALSNTGRLSSSDPNLQNIPIRTDEGREIRKAFVAEAGYEIMSIDYSQIELRLVAAIANVSKLKEAFLNGIDIHAHTAAHVFHLKPEEMTADFRRKAKAVNFGILYGISAYGLSQQLHCTSAEAQALIDAYFLQFPELKAYMDGMIEFGRKHGYVLSLFGRKSYVPTIRDKIFAKRQFAERQAINAPLQSTQADIIKKAMVQISAYLKAQNLKTRMLLQVHDELVFEVPMAEKDLVAAEVKRIMESVMSLSVPLTAEVGFGVNWQDAH